MIGRIASIVAALILVGWLYWLTARVQVLLTHAEAALDRADRTLAAAVALVGAAPVTPPAAAVPLAAGPPRRAARPPCRPAWLSKRRSGSSWSATSPCTAHRGGSPSRRRATTAPELHDLQRSGKDDLAAVGTPGAPSAVGSSFHRKPWWF
ncbi:hypothetical protein [Blastococcus brunescens]|uniref:Uncharacterized protein n=1 Tax=Blastococcus brunescens TaxID=1564165 RepID=A0ABZ1B394_9ACTN|nr:hypothetical protein [Blastococcus sp. BMG 8361]WRL64847.1 hypothetical protein U6N30_03640 [Blastococcus sp. BMG 8361]